MAKRYWALLCFFGVLPWLILDVVNELRNRIWVFRDFDDLWLAGRMALHGQAADVFDIPKFRAAYVATFHVPQTYQLYSYPPFGLFLATPFGALPYPAAFILWNALTLGFFLWAARPFMSDRLPWWVVAFTPAGIICLGFGQYGLLTSALFLLAFRGSGLSAAALTFKPQLGFLVAVRLLREPKAFAVAVIATLALVVVSILVFGVDAWEKFFTSTIPLQFARVGANEVNMTGKQVAATFSYGLIGQAVFALAAIYLITRCFNVFTAATATFLISPYGFHYDMPIVCLGFAYLLATRELDLWKKAALILAFSTPGLTLGVQWAVPPILLLGLFVQVEEWRVRSLEPFAGSKNISLKRCVTAS